MNKNSVLDITNTEPQSEFDVLQKRHMARFTNLF